jgi:hypothetical protein
VDPELFATGPENALMIELFKERITPAITPIAYGAAIIGRYDEEGRKGWVPRL